jgi:ribonucleoside-diphosphate reductase beta chain
MPVDYSQREKSFELYRKGKREGTWDPDDFEFEQDKEDWAAFSDSEQALFLTIASGFYEGEEDVTRTLSPYMYALDSLDRDAVPFDPVQEEMYLSQQVYEEAKHTDFFSRYFEEVFETQDVDQYNDDGDGDAYSIKDLYEKGEDLIDAARGGNRTALVHTLGEAYLEYMGMVEAQGARRGYLAFDQMADIKADQMGRETVLPGYQAAVGKIRQDETRHIENGRWMLRQLAETEPSVVEEVYEPRIEAYIEHELVAGDRVEADGVTIDEAYPGFDGWVIHERTMQFLQDTVDYIGADRFDRVSDIEAAVKQRRAQAADD